ncbi:MAG: prepilin peptidase [Bacillota bacterium]
MSYINLSLAAILVAVCTWTDIKKRIIYNVVTYPSVLAGIVLNILSGTYVNLYQSLIVFVIYLYFFMSGKIGAGDLKLAVALSLFLGIQPVLLGSLAAGVIMMVYGFSTTWHKTGLQAAVMVAAGKIPGGEVPYGAVMGPLTLGIAFLNILLRG